MDQRPRLADERMRPHMIDPAERVSKSIEVFEQPDVRARLVGARARPRHLELQSGRWVPSED